MPFAFEQRNNALFMHRRQAGKQRGALRQLGQLVIAQMLNIATNNHFARIQPNFMAHFRRHQLAVAGQDFDGDTAGLQRLQCRRSRLFRRIEERNVAFEDQVGLINTLVVTFPRREKFAGHRHHAQPLAVQSIRDTLNATQHGLIQRHHFTVVINLRTDVEDLLQRPFADQFMNVRFFTHHHRHSTTFEIKWNFIHLLPVAGELTRRHFIDPFQHRCVEQIFQPSLVMAI